MLTEALVQDVAAVLSSYWKHSELDKAIRRFSLEEEASVDYGASKENRIYGLLKETDATEKGLQVLEFLVSKVPFGEEDTRRLERLLAGADILLDSNQGYCTIRPEAGIASRKARSEQRAFIEAESNDGVRHHLQESRQKLANGNNDGAIGECRLALEAMTTGSFKEALDQLLSHGLISKGDGKQRKVADYEILYDVFGYCSTLGQHTSAHKTMPSIPQAIHALMLTEHTIFFSIRIVKDARTVGQKLDKWSI